MTEPLRLPIRVLVKGPSTVNWTSWSNGPRTDFIFPRVIEEKFCEEGRPSRVETITMTSEQAKRLTLNWQAENLGFSPDVIVLAYGQQEVMHLFLPRWLERHAHSLKVRNRRLSKLYRKAVVKPTWKMLARLQARVDKTLKPKMGRKQRTVPLDIESYITQVQKVGSPMVIVMETMPPTKKFGDWFPGMAERTRLMTEANKAVVERIGMPHVQFMTVLDLVDEVVGGDIDLAIPDGFHYTPQMHRAVGEKLHRMIVDWAETQQHLKTPGDPA